MMSTAIIAAASLATFTRGAKIISDRVKFKREAMRVAGTTKIPQNWWFMDVDVSNAARPTLVNASRGVNLNKGAVVLDEGAVEAMRRASVGGYGFYTTHVPVAHNLVPRFSCAKSTPNGNVVRIVGKL